MQILSALFADDIALRQVDGPSTRIDLTGIQFSAVAPGPFPVTVAPHLIVIVRCAEDEDGEGVLEVVYRREGEQIARNVQMVTVEPGKFSYRLVRGEMDFDGPGTVEAHCRIGTGDAVVVPYTLLAVEG
jgi:hypothetical protein